MNAKPCLQCALAAALLLFSGACRKSSAPATTSTAESAPAAGAKERHHRLFANGVSPLIVSMSPETIVFHNGHVPVTRFSLTYEINGAEKATKAYISVVAHGVGEVQHRDVDVQPSAQIEFLLDASDYDLGPTVRFRAHCPFGDTAWFLMGSDPMPYPQRLSSREIGDVGPPYVPAMGRRMTGGLPITIWGSEITKACTPEAQVDDSGVDLQSVVARDKQITGLLPYDSLQGRPVVSRHLEVNLVVTGPGMSNADIYNLNFTE